MIQVWGNVTKEQVYQFCPSLAIFLAAQWAGNAQALADQLVPIIRA